MEGAGTSDGGDEADFTSWRVRDLKGFLAERGVSGYGVLERSELETLCEQASRGVLEGRCVRRLLTCGAPRAQRPLVCRAPVLRASADGKGTWAVARGHRRGPRVRTTMAAAVAPVEVLAIARGAPMVATWPLRRIWWRWTPSRLWAT